MARSPLAGLTAPADLRIEPVRCEQASHERRPDADITDQAVSHGTEDVYKLHAESARWSEHLDAMFAEGQQSVAVALGGVPECAAQAHACADVVSEPARRHRGTAAAGAIA